MKNKTYIFLLYMLSSLHLPMIFSSQKLGVSISTKSSSVYPVTKVSGDHILNMPISAQVKVRSLNKAQQALGRMSASHQVTKSYAVRPDVEVKALHIEPLLDTQVQSSVVSKPRGTQSNVVVLNAAQQALSRIPASYQVTKGFAQGVLLEPQVQVDVDGIKLDLEDGNNVGTFSTQSSLSSLTSAGTLRASQEPWLVQVVKKGKQAEKVKEKVVKKEIKPAVEKPGWFAKQRRTLSLLFSSKNPDRVALTPLQESVKALDLKEIKKLVRSEVPVDIQTPEGDTLLHLALKNRVSSQDHAQVAEVVTYLLRKGVDPNIANKKSELAIHYAVDYLNVDAVDQLIQSRARVNVRNDQGQYPLTTAVSLDMPLLARAPEGLPERQAQVIRLLLDAGADITVKGPHNRSPYDDAHYAVTQRTMLPEVKKYFAPALKQQSAAYYRANPHLIV